MSQTHQRRYSATHQWASPLGDGVFAIGITDFAQQQLGDIMFLSLPQSETSVTAGQCCATIESVKSASDIYAPLSGTIIDINNALLNQLEAINTHPYENWLFKIKTNTPQDFDQLLTDEQYHKLIS